MAIESAGWPVAQGIVLKSGMEYRHQGSNKRGAYGKYRVEFLYEFRVFGKNYRSNRIAFGKTNSGDFFRAGTILKKYPKGKRVAVYYLLANPNISVLEPGTRAFLYLLPSTGALLFLLSIGVPIYREIRLRKARKLSRNSTSTD